MTERLRYLDVATRRIARGSDLQEILLGLCRAAVPAFADAILAYLRDPLPVGDEKISGTVTLRLRRIDRVPAEPERSGASVPLLSQRSAGSGAAEAAQVQPDGQLMEVLSRGRPAFASAAAPDDQGAVSLGELLGQPALRDLPPGNRTILAPLRGRHNTIGAAVLLRSQRRPAFQPDDLLVASQLATLTALGVEKAVLYGREAYIADSLQHSMLPAALPELAGIRLAHRYLPAAESARVGGDWYDAIPLPGNRMALVVGDVMGHSMTSAALMGQLRIAVQTLAGLDLPPQEVLHHLEEQAQRLGGDPMATCVYGVYDPVDHRLLLCNAGHPPPLLLHSDGRVEVLKLPPGVPIGVGGVPFHAVDLPAPVGATLLLYTDGLVESRDRDVWTGIEQLRDYLAKLAGPGSQGEPPDLAKLCDSVLEVVGPAERADDIALLAARFDGIPASDVAFWTLEPNSRAPRRARRLVLGALRRWGLDALREATELLVDEVVTNAVRHAARPITLRLLRTDVLRCEVGDDNPRLPWVRHAMPSDEVGRGLYVVSRVAERWGASRVSTGKIVWFEQKVP